MSNEKKPILVKIDRELGLAFFCPYCKTFQCISRGPCTKCKGEIDWTKSEWYEGKVKWR